VLQQLDCVACKLTHHCAVFWVSCFARNAEALERQVGKESIVWFLGNTSVKNYRNRMVYVKIIASQRWDVFETQCISHYITITLHYKNSSGDEIANVNFFTTTSCNTSKYNPLLNIQHDAGRGAASGCGLVVLVRKALKARRLATTEYSCAPRSRAQHGHGLLPVHCTAEPRHGNNG